MILAAGKFKKPGTSEGPRNYITTWWRNVKATGFMQKYREGSHDEAGSKRVESSQAHSFIQFSCRS
jgi:hypothetical protein